MEQMGLSIQKNPDLQPRAADTRQQPAEREARRRRPPDVTKWTVLEPLKMSLSFDISGWGPKNGPKCHKMDGKYYVGLQREGFT